MRRMGKPVKTLHALNWYYGNICSCRFGIFSKRLVRTSALPTARWRAISKMPFKLRKNTMPRRFAPRLFLTISQKVKIGGGGEIRTLGGLPHTDFPGLRTRPLCEPSKSFPHYGRKWPKNKAPVLQTARGFTTIFNGCYDQIFKSFSTSAKFILVCFPLFPPNLAALFNHPFFF